MITFTIYGDPASKANSRRIIWTKGPNGKRRVMSIKSEKALTYAKRWKDQCPRLAHPYTGPVGVEITIYYASKRPDLDPSLILDLLQDFVYVNDRQVHEMHFFRELDREEPRSVITVWELDGKTVWPNDIRSRPELGLDGTDERREDT